MDANCDGESWVEFVIHIVIGDYSIKHFVVVRFIKRCPMNLRRASPSMSRRVTTSFLVFVVLIISISDFVFV
jgi:hypothetical protein